MSITVPQWKYRSRILNIQKHIWILVSGFILLLSRNRLKDGLRVKGYVFLCADTDKEWLQFVVDCRNGKDVYRNYDAIIGNVANDDVFKCVSMFMDGIWDEERTLHELRYYRKNDQIAFLTQDIIDVVVKFKESYEVSG